MSINVAVLLTITTSPMKTHVMSLHVTFLSLSAYAPASSDASWVVRVVYKYRTWINTWVINDNIVVCLYRQPFYTYYTGGVFLSWCLVSVLHAFILICQTPSEQLQTLYQSVLWHRCQSARVHQVASDSGCTSWLTVRSPTAHNRWFLICAAWYRFICAICWCSKLHVLFSH